MSYHLAEIPRGVYGEVSKIEEELAELKDAIAQGNRIMALVELSDLVGAVEGILIQHYAGIDLADLIVMAGATRRAFESGHRK